MPYAPKRKATKPPAHAPYSKRKLPVRGKCTPSNPFKVVQTVDYGSISYVSTTTGATGGALVFTLNLLDDFSSYSGVFDTYRVDKIQWRFLPYRNFNNSTAADIGNFNTVLDYDDNVVPTSANQLRQYDNHMLTPNYTALSRSCKPKPRQAYYQGAFTAGGQPTAQPWLDIASPDIIHYGLKWLLEANNTALTDTRVFRCTAKVWLSFASPR